MINCQVCEHNPSGERCELFGRVIGMHGCSSGEERKPRNNYERLKAMSVEEMADFLGDIIHDWGEGSAYLRAGTTWIDDWLKWLKEEKEDAETE